MVSAQKTALVLGGGGFIGNAMVSRLKKENYWVRSVDLKYPEFSTSEAAGPVNIGSGEMVTINQLVDYVSKIANKKVERKHKLDAPLGVRGRNSDNPLIEKELKWKPEWTLAEGQKKLMLG